MTWRMESRSMIPKSCRICMTGLAERLNSSWTSSYWRSSMRFWPLISDSNGLEMSSAISAVALGDGLGISPDGGSQLEFLQLGLDGDRILGFSDDLLPGDHAGEVFVDEETVQSNHAVLGPGLDVGLDAEGFVVADQCGDR